MATKVSINGLAAAVSKELRLYSEKALDAVADAADETAGQSIKVLGQAGGYKDRSGKYRKGFYKRKERTYRGAKSTLANKEYRLTHLLEFGHSIHGGTGRTEAFPHWKEEEERANADYEQRLRTKLEGLS